MEKTNEKKVLVLSFLGVITLILVVVGATYAYFTAQGGGTGNINVNAGTATTDNLSFQTGSAISLTANQEDFGSGMSNKSGSTYARAILTANNATNTATRNYYVYLNITSNDFEYTTVDEQGEILLKVTDHDGTEVTSLSGLTRKTSGSGDNQVTGFDITESQGLITIANNYEITSTGTETQEWQVEVIFVNLDSDQNANTGKSFSANLIIQEEPMQTRVNLASYITDTLYTEDGVNGLYYHDGSGSYINADQEAGDNSYRYAGANPNNYVCFGSNDATCPEDNLYRIIGVFEGQVKLIKSTSIGNYVWNSEKVNTWNQSIKPDIYTTLNETYYHGLEGQWQLLISSNDWYVNRGNVAFAGISNSTIKEVFTNEINEVRLVENMKIGLMYASDYGYASSSENWLLNLVEYNSDSNINNNWMFTNINEWTLTLNVVNEIYSFYIDSSGIVECRNFNVDSSLAVRPSFYLKSDVELMGGTGTVSDPYRIA